MTFITVKCHHEYIRKGWWPLHCSIMFYYLFIANVFTTQYLWQKFLCCHCRICSKKSLSTKKNVWNWMEKEMRILVFRFIWFVLLTGLCHILNAIVGLVVFVNANINLSSDSVANKILLGFFLFKIICRLLLLLLMDSSFKFIYFRKRISYCTDI